MQDRLPPDRRKPLATRGRTIHWGQKRRFDSLPATSGLPLRADIVRPAQHVSLVPITASARRGCLGFRFLPSLVAGLIAIPPCACLRRIWALAPPSKGHSAQSRKPKSPAVVP